MSEVKRYRSEICGSGYKEVVLATDYDYLRAALQRIATLDKRPYLTMFHGDAGYIYDLQKIAREALGVPHD